MESVLKYNGGPSASHFVIALDFAFAFVAASFFLDNFLFRRLSGWLLRGGATDQLILNKATREKIVKCSESMWKLSYYSTLEFCICLATYHEPWFKDVTEYFRGWPNQELKFPLKLIYMCQSGFYMYSVAALLMWETRRKDFLVMMSHHVVTVILISGSYITRCVKL